MEKLFSCGIIVLISCIAVGYAEKQPQPHLLIQKSVLVSRPFAGKDIPFQYRLFNIGSGPAYDVTLEDDWSAEEYSVVSGMVSGSWPQIPAGGNVTHIVVLKAHSFGYKSSTPAKVTYKATQDAADVQVGYSNDLGLIPVLSHKEDNKLSAPHITEWLLFIAMAAGLGFLPLFLFRPQVSADAGKKKVKSN
ncbi:hypothetical protein GUITHDRAFT_137181 [Guillardia theta CCMP2712]|uniref:Translocon-associated protein subunit beta n=2 Tax=Guillardia theta TaxID=55529 RepID=L1JH19_GUITC|nr:hypothetical protein GUITHDRAFT_137181 [Guillardia theta CCMP2712]EKX47798.1 hypothetical protein GUITHDRAFT_137181 [Guillardia theta CCMP2712]|eukprot:XP_005834778.1 hypothetical protein GUITHDRAFT_137181 [Guillardia theta CCMP2712]